MSRAGSTPVQADAMIQSRYELCMRSPKAIFTNTIMACRRPNLPPVIGYPA